MKYKFFVILLIIAGFSSLTKLYSDDNTSKSNGSNPVIQQSFIRETSALTIGVLQGGGSLIGADLEFLVSNNVGVQAGAGLFGYGAGLNFHFKPTVRSSFISLVYWHQGFKSNYTQSMIGGTFVFRAKKIFTAQLGLGYRVGYSSSFAELIDINKPLMALYSIGIYFPLDQH